MKKKPETIEFPYLQFPVLVMHKDGKEMQDTKKCYFQNMNHAEKYITKSRFKQKDYQLFVKPGTNVKTITNKK